MFKNYSIILSFVGGVISFFSPCILPLIPLYFSYMTGISLEKIKEEKILNYKKILLPTICFIFGFTLIFVILGTSFSFLGKFIFNNKKVLSYISGIIMIILGLHISGFIRIEKLYEEKRIKLKKLNYGCLSSFLIGIGLASGWTPCVGPILSSILLLASNQETIEKGILLLFFYSLGIGVPFLTISLFIQKIFIILKKIQKIYKKIEIFSGFLLVISGLYLILFKN